MTVVPECSNLRKSWHRLGRAVRVTGVVAAVLAIAGPLPAYADAADGRNVVRLAVVNTPVDSGLLATLLPKFETETGYRVEVARGGDAYDRARAGEADLVISHYGKGAVEGFVRSGIGLWPRPVFASRLVLVGPSEDPAGIRGLDDPFEAMRRIAASESPFVLGKSAGTRYLAEILLAGVGDPAREPWFELTELSGEGLVSHAREKGGYTVLAALGFARMRQSAGAGMEVMLDDPPLFQRIMVIVRVDPSRIEGVNAQGAKALERYLLSPNVQARIAAFREPGSGRAMWSPAARHNHSKGLMRRLD
jgi:tungstate transport system substrate-binding protein